MITSAIRTTGRNAEMLLLAGCLAMISACSSEAEGTSQPDDAIEEPVLEGVYTGEITSTITGETLSLVAFVDDWGYMRFATKAGQYEGFPDSPDTPLTGITTAGYTWPDESTTSSFSFEISQLSSSDLQGTYAGAGDEGMWSLQAEPNITRYPDEGLYMLYDDSRNHIATFEIRGRGLILGSDIDGCVYNGLLNQDGWTFHYIYEVNLTAENCPPNTEETSNGDYYGMGGFTAVTEANANPVLTLAVDNGAQALLLDLEML
jgi:hypothetical protein